MKSGQTYRKRISVGLPVFTEGPNLDRLIFVNFQDTSRGGIENNPGIDFFSNSPSTSASVYPYWVSGISSLKSSFPL